MSASLEELERLYRMRFPDFLRVATALSGSLETGRGAVHEGFVRAVRSRGDFRGTGSLDGWVWKAVVSSALSRRRRERREDEASHGADVLPGSNADVCLDVRAAVSALPERQRVVLFLRYYADLDYPRAKCTIAGLSRAC